MIYIENETEAVFDFGDPQAAIDNVISCIFRDKDLPEELDVNVLIVSEDDIRQINNDSRGIDSVTDVLSFPYYDIEEPGVFEGVIYEDGENILGDMIICAEKVISQAQEYGHSQMRELSFLTVHSMLHLIGYDHIEEEDGELMRSEEKRIMDILGIPR
mgnify:CR=1 FL=1